MDLLGRKAKAQLELALAWIEDLQFRLDQATLQLEIKQGVSDRLAAELHDKLAQVRELESALNAVPRRMTATPLYKSEEEEELEFALRNGDINVNEFKDLMAQAGFENTEVELPTSPQRPIVY